MDGAVIADRLDGGAIALDPGSHEFTFQSEERPPLSETLVLREEEISRRETVTFAAPAEVAPPATAPAAACTPSSPPSASASGADVAERRPAESRSGQRTLALVVGGVGAAGVVAGIVFGSMTLAAWGSVKSECPRLVDCSAAAYDDRSRALTYGTISTVSLIAGSVLLAGGAVLYLTAPRAASQPEVGVAAGPGGVSLSGCF
ncbi:MAG: hypothetical protein ACRENE_14665 [Polyangiaceae bacterium]